MKQRIAGAMAAIAIAAGMVLIGAPIAHATDAPGVSQCAVVDGKTAVSRPWLLRENEDGQKEWQWVCLYAVDNPTPASGGYRP